jgi:flagellar biogenesis protein FliO
VIRKQTVSKPGTLSRAFSWLKKQYPVVQEKRLQLSENIQLGEKRFVALVTVDGREFLIGGGPSGLSLLSQWDSGDQTPPADRRALPIRESFE